MYFGLFYLSWGENNSKIREGLEKLDKQLFVETQKRSFVKSITYRTAATIVLVVSSWIFTEDFFQTSAITISFTILATIVYYFHERIWDKIKWGRQRQETKT
jgi:uncharacterized membrane protein